MSIRRQIFSNILIIIICLVFSHLLNGCSTPKLRVSEFDFRYNNQNYLIRSAYCPNNPESCNQLIGDKFIAVDLNQDRIIDKIIKGEIELSQAQEIYDFCLNLLEKEGKLNEIDRANSKFIYNESDYNYQIVSLHAKNNSSFNEITITDKSNSSGKFNVSVFIDREADGKLDELLKGEMTLGEAQGHYDKVIKKGLALNELVKSNGQILCR